MWLASTAKTRWLLLLMKTVLSSSSEYTQQLNTHCRQNALFLNVKAVVHVVIKVYFGSFINHPQQAIFKHFSGDTDN